MATYCGCRSGIHLWSKHWLLRPPAPWCDWRVNNEKTIFGWQVLTRVLEEGFWAKKGSWSRVLLISVHISLPNNLFILNSSDFVVLKDSCCHELHFPPNVSQRRWSITERKPSIVGLKSLNCAQFTLFPLITDGLLDLLKQVIKGALNHLLWQLDLLHGCHKHPQTPCYAKLTTRLLTLTARAPSRAPPTSAGRCPLCCPAARTNRKAATSVYEATHPLNCSLLRPPVPLSPPNLLLHHSCFSQRCSKRFPWQAHFRTPVVPEDRMALALWIGSQL